MSCASQMSLSAGEWIKVDVVDGGNAEQTRRRTNAKPNKRDAEQTRGAGQVHVGGKHGGPIFTGAEGWFQK